MACREDKTSVNQLVEDIMEQYMLTVADVCPKEAPVVPKQRDPKLWEEAQAVAAESCRNLDAYEADSLGGLIADRDDCLYIESKQYLLQNSSRFKLLREWGMRLKDNMPRTISELRQTLSRTGTESSAKDQVPFLLVGVLLALWWLILVLVIIFKYMTWYERFRFLLALLFMLATVGGLIESSR
jgi:hypothetical protein